MSFLDNILQGGGTAADLATTDVPVNVSNATPPNPGDVLKAVDATHATWQPGGGSGSDAGGLETTGDPVDVSNAAPPVEGQVLTAVDAEHAVWRVPGLHYDPGIKFWTNSVGSATIGPGTWGFISQPADGVSPVVVYIVSSLEAPPVDSRFGLYVGRDVTVPVTVSVLGASQIQGTDGVLGPNTTLLPGADYEWVFYHEDSAALWGLVSDTAGIAKRIAVAGGTVEVAGAAAPISGQVLIALDAEHAAWSDAGPAVWPTLGDAFTNALYVSAIVPADDDLYGNSGTIDGVNSGDIVVLTVGQIDPNENGFWQTWDGDWQHPSGYPLAEDIAVGQLVVVQDGTEFAGSMWTYRGSGQWDQISPGSPITGGDFMTRVGNKIHLVGPLTDAVHGNRGGGALHADATTTVSGFFSGAEKVKLAGIAASAAALTSAAASQITVATAAAGSGTTSARNDHIHSVATAVPVSLAIGGTNTLGTSTSLPRADHVHALPNVATASVSGFMSSTDKSKLDAASVTAGWVLTATGPGSGYRTIPAPPMNNLRLSGASNVPVSPDGTVSSIWLVPYTGSQIVLFIPGTSGFVSTDGLYAIAINPALPPSVALSGMVAGTPVDVMAYASSATAVTLELLQWSSPTARATGITQSAYGFWTKAADSSRRYLGTLLPASATTVTQLRKGVGAKGICGIWNADNRVRSQFSWAANVADWTVATANTWLPFNGDANSRVDWVTGLSVEDVVMTGYATLAPTGFDCAIGVGFDVTNAASGLRGYGAGTGITMPGVTAHAAQPGIGAHYAAMLGRSTGTVSHIYGTTSLTAAGMVADLFW